MEFIYGLILGSAGITKAFMNFYPKGGSLKFHRDEFLQKFGNCKPVAYAEKVQTKRYVHKADTGRVSFRACNDDAPLKQIDTRCYGMGPDGRGVTSMTQHKAEPGPGVKGWDTSLVIDCTHGAGAQHARASPEDDHGEPFRRLHREPRPELGQEKQEGI